MQSNPALVELFIQWLTSGPAEPLHLEVENYQFAPLREVPDDGELHCVNYEPLGDFGEIFVDVANVNGSVTSRHAARYRFVSSYAKITLWPVTSYDARWVTELLQDLAQAMFAAIPAKLL